MATRPLRNALIGLALAAAAAAAAFAPVEELAGSRPPVDLEAMVPAQFGTWRSVAGLVPVTASAEPGAGSPPLYAQVVARTYADERGRRVMLSIAYGRDQRGDALHAHRPEYCYEAQGFAVRRLADESVTTAQGPLPVRRLFAQRGLRHEPITYWTTVGERVARPGIERKLAQLRFGLARTVPDGMLVRVSSLDADPAAARPLQDLFIRELQGALSGEVRRRVFGTS